MTVRNLDALFKPKAIALIGGLPRKHRDRSSSCGIPTSLDCKVIGPPPAEAAPSPAFRPCLAEDQNSGAREALREMQLTLK
jgi:hypothetical protein